jgi:hypothetical protein
MMTEKTPKMVPMNEIRTEAGAQELVRSEKMRPYLDLLKAQIGGQDAEPYRATLAALPLEDRYIWRVASALKWALCDLETENVAADMSTLSTEDIKIVAEPLALRAMQFSLFASALLGEQAAEQIMLQAIKCAKDVGEN